MDEDLQDRIASLRASRRAGAREVPSTELLQEWVVHKHIGEVDSMQSFTEQFNAQVFDEKKLTVVSADYLEKVGSGADAQQVQSAQLSFTFRFPTDCSDTFVRRNAPTILQVLAVSILDTLRAMIPDKEELTFALKCPWDILVNNKKIGCAFAHDEVAAESPHEWIMVSADIFLTESATEPMTTSLRSMLGSDLMLTAETLGFSLASTFAAALWNLFVHGFKHFTERVNLLEFHRGQQIEFVTSQSKVLQGTFLGVNDSGIVVIQFVDGKTNLYLRNEVVVRKILCPQPY